MINPATVFWIGITVAAYYLSLEARKRWPSPLTTPVLLSSASIVAVLLLLHATFHQYASAKTAITVFLGPATVALAVPLFKNRNRLGNRAVPAMVGFLAGSLSTLIVAAIIARACGFSATLVSSIALKSTTVPIAVEIAKIVHGDPALTAAFVVCTGMIGAAFGPWLLDRVSVTDLIARGVALGTIAHGQGTAQAATEAELSGATAGVAMGLAGLTTALVAPQILPLVIR